MHLQKNKNSNTIGFLADKVKQKQGQDKKTEDKKTTAKTDGHSGVVRSKPLLDPSNVFNNPKGILSAGQGRIKEEGAPQKSQSRMATSNSIFEPDKIDRMSSELSNKEKTDIEKQKIKDYRQSHRQERLDSMVESLKDVDNRKDSSVSSAASYRDRSNSSFGLKKNMSIFDSFDGNNDFNRIPDKTQGESLKDVKERATNKDKSPQTLRPISTKQKNKSTFNNLLGE